MRKRLVIFDFNGTIQNDVSWVYAGVRGIFAHFGVTPPTFEEYIRDIVPEFGPFYWERGIPRTVTEEELNEIIADVLARESPPDAFPDAVSVIRALARDSCTCAVVSGWPEPGLSCALARHGIRDAAAFVRGGVARKAPVFRECMEAFGILPEQTYAVGDTVPDAEAAAAVGVKPLLCPRGFYSRARIEAARGRLPTMEIIETFENIPAHFR